MNYDVNKNGYWFSKEQLDEHDKQIKADLIREVEKKVRAEVIEELFNTPKDEFGGMTLKEVYEQPCFVEFDEGWDKCYEDFEFMAEQLKEQK